MERTRTMSQYTVDIDLLKVMELDSKHEDDRDWDNTLFHHVDKIKGVTMWYKYSYEIFKYETDYNGHFGSVVFINLDAEFDTPETWEVIEKTINDYMES